MEKIKIETTQNVDIEYSIASIGDRILGFLLDALFLFIYGMVMSLILERILRSPDIIIGSVLPFVIYLPAIFYDLLCELFMDGQSFGKKLMKTKVVKIDGSVPGIGSYLLRWLLRFVDISLSIGVVAIVTIASNGRGQRVGDIAGKTTVIKLKDDASFEDTIFAETGVDYKTVYQQVKLLSDKDISIIKELIEANNNSSAGDNIFTANLKAKQNLERKLGIESVEAPLKFFNTLVKDYNNEIGRV